jgi:hypothetical protein
MCMSISVSVSMFVSSSVSVYVSVTVYASVSIKYSATNIFVQHRNYLDNFQGPYKVAQKPKGPLT